MRISGCTVHFVTAEIDAGPIIAQAAVPVLAGDTAETLADRILRAEHKLYPHALRAGRRRARHGWRTAACVLRRRLNQADLLISPTL